MDKDKNNITQEWTHDAISTLHKMRYKCHEIGNTFGTKSEEYAEACESLMNCVTSMPGWGGIVYKDSEYSLLLVGSMTIGIIFHRKTKKRDGYGDEEFEYGTWSSHS